MDFWTFDKWANRLIITMLLALLPISHFYMV